MSVTNGGGNGATAPLLEVRGLHMHFPITEGMIARRRIGGRRRSVGAR